MPRAIIRDSRVVHVRPPARGRYRQSVSPLLGHNVESHTSGILRGAYATHTFSFYPDMIGHFFR